jgi:hypothetical protein
MEESNHAYRFCRNIFYLGWKQTLLRGTFWGDVCEGNADVVDFTHSTIAQLTVNGTGSTVYITLHRLKKGTTEWLWIPSFGDEDDAVVV